MEKQNDFEADIIKQFENLTAIICTMFEEIKTLQKRIGLLEQVYLENKDK